VINRAPRIWGVAYRIIDRFPGVARLLTSTPQTRRCLARVLEEKQPDAVISVYPAYSYFIERLYRSVKQPFRFYTVVTDSITINSVWHRCPSDIFFVPNEQTLRVMVGAGVASEKLRDFGFPVQPRFARERPARPAPDRGNLPRLLFMINAGMKGAIDMVRSLLNVPRLRLTVTVGRDQALRTEIEQAARGRSIEIHGWTDQMPELLMTHHVLIGKAGGAAVQEAIAACTPMLITSVVPGQEEGNARLLLENGCGALCATANSLVNKLEALFADDAREWHQWEQAIGRLSRPDAALQIARFVLDEK
jgi:UDP-N-acetylglucosamine:LPS N-acetylglucosamine transferase